MRAGEHLNAAWRVSAIGQPPQTLEVFGCAFPRDVVTQPANQAKPAHGRRRKPGVRQRPGTAQRNRDVDAPAGFEAEKVARCDADDGERSALQLNRPANDGRIAAKISLPEAVADHRDRPRGLVILEREPAANGRSYTHDVETVAGDELPGHDLCG